MAETVNAGDAGHLQLDERNMKDGPTLVDIPSLLSLYLIQGLALNFFSVVMNDSGLLMMKCGSKD